MKISHQTTDYRKYPLNIGHGKPVFGWRVEGEEQGIRQESYRIRVWQGECGSGEPVWDSGRRESLQMTGIRYGGEKLVSDCRYGWQLEISCRYGEEAVSALTGESWFETGYLDREEWKGSFIGETSDYMYHLYRKTFALEGEIKRAKLYICGMGHFECRLNGIRVSDHVLEPGWSDYNETCFYTSYDVTALAAERDNCLLVKLGDGMFNVPGGRYVYYERSYGKCKLLAQLVLEYKDGRKQLIVTDSSWRMAPGPIKFCCIYGGEDYDARFWKKAYLYADYNEEAVWEPAVCVEPPKGKLTPMPMEPVKVMETYRPVSIKEIRPGVWLYDFGTNFSGWARIKLRADASMAGSKIVLKPGEMVNADGTVNQQVTGEGYAWTYILDENQEQEFAPDFTYTGFRYLEMTGALPKTIEGVPTEKKEVLSERNARTEEENSLPVITEMVGEFIYSDVEQAGEFKCSNQLFCDIHRIVLQAIKSNTKSYFTDCPHREKLGWLEQTHLIGPSIMYNMDVHNLYAKIEGDMADSQRENGLVPDICPEYVTGFEKWHRGFVDSPEWGSACILSPWYIYRRYGDTGILEKYYDVMKKYVNYLGEKTHHEILHHGLGDWLDIGPCTPHSQNTPVPVVATCIYYYDLDIMKQTAELLHKTQDGAEFTERMKRVKEEYNRQFLDDQTGRYANGSQTAQAMSLMTGLVPEAFEERVADMLKKDVVKRKYAITAGDVGHPFLVAALMKYGMSDLLNEMTMITERPGYGYQVVNGATTLTEEWDGPEPGRPHGSQNHLMLGSIEEWFYGSLGGVELIRKDLPFDEIRIAPQPQAGVDWAEVWVMHPYGRIGVSWKRRGEEVEVKCQVPPNVTARLEAPGKGVLRTVGSGKYTYRFGDGND
nr:alpha-L-rhamnosidase [uncultured Acetatifactor sp.]